MALRKNGVLVIPKLKIVHLKKVETKPEPLEILEEIIKNLPEEKSDEELIKEIISEDKEVLKELSIKEED